MKKPKPIRPIERLFPFALRAAVVVPGRETLHRLRKKLLFILITTDLSENSRETILREFASVPIVQRFTAADVEKHFGFQNTKVLGFKKSSLAKSILDELRAPPPEPPPAQP